MPLSTSWSSTRLGTSHPPSRFSTWFHGRSVVGSERSHSLVPAPKAWRTRGRSESPERRAPLGPRSDHRSPSSTRSIIDRTSSPNIGTEPAQPDAFDRSSMSLLSPIAGTRHEEEEIVGVSGPTRTRTRLALSRPKGKTSLKKQGRGCFPGVQDRRIKRKIIGTLVSGIALCVILTTYLALAISNSVTGKAFHAILVVLIILTTIIFCHYLIRLFMLAMRPQSRPHNSGLLYRSQAGAVARPHQPIRVILARDEELGLDGTDTVEEDKETAVPPPPPAYGVWRCSVRADPNLIHWQRTGQPTIAEEFPLVMRSESTRPPSYRSQHRAAEVERVAGPAQAYTRNQHGCWESHAQHMGAGSRGPSCTDVIGGVWTQGSR